MGSVSKVFFSLFLISFSSYASDDPCIQALAVSSGAEAASLASYRDGSARPEAMKELDKATRGESVRGVDPVYKAQRKDNRNNDAQNKAQWTADGLRVAAKWNNDSAPVFLAGAMKELNPKVKSDLMQCYQRRSSQGQADDKAAEENERVARKAAEGDGKNRNSLATGYQAEVILVDQTRAAAQQQQPDVSKVVQPPKTMAGMVLPELY